MRAVIPHDLPHGASSGRASLSGAPATNRSVPATAAALALAATACVAFGAHIRAFWPFTVDDAFITLRYAKNLAAGIGLTFNSGPIHAEGYSSPLCTVFLALPHLAGIDAVDFAKAVGVALSAATLVVVARTALLVHRGPGAGVVAAMAAALLAATPTFALHAVSGMETALFIFVVSVFFLASVTLGEAPSRVRLTVLAALGLALGLTRPEGNLIAAAAYVVLLARCMGRRRALLGTVALIHILPGALYFLWRWAYHGLPFPLPFYVKLAANGGPRGISDVMGFLSTYGIRLGLLGIAGLPVILRRAPAALAGIAALFLFFLFPEHLMGYEHRFLIASVPLFAIAAALGVASLWRWGAFLGRLRILPAAFALAAAAHALLGLAPRALEWSREYTHGLARAHIALGHRLAARFRDGRCVLAIADAGAVPYYSGCTTIDTFGLNEPVIARGGRGDADYVLRQSPDVLVLISADRDRLEPHLPWEAQLHARALERGMSVIDRLEFLPKYWLWVLEPNPPSLQR
jgi:arabinofuranosyltransferase